MPSRGELDRHHLRHGDDAALRGAVGGAPEIAAHAADRGDVDDRAAAGRPHCGDGGAGDEEGADDVDVEDAPELGRGDLVERLVLRDPGRVDDAAQGTDPFGGLRHRGRDRRLVGDVERHPHDPLAPLRELGLGPLQPGGVAVGDRDAPAVGGELSRRREPDPGRAAGDERPALIHRPHSAFESGTLVMASSGPSPDLPLPEGEVETALGGQAITNLLMLRCEAKPSLEARTGGRARHRQGCVLRGSPRVKPGGRTSG